MMTAHSAHVTAEAILDPSIIREQIGDDTDFLREIVEGYREQRGEMLTAIRTGVQLADGAAIAATAHKLKGSLLTLGACAASDCAKQLEYAGKAGMIGRAEEWLRALLEEIARLDTALDALIVRGLAA